MIIMCIGYGRPSRLTQPVLDTTASGDHLTTPIGLQKGMSLQQLRLAYQQL